MFWVFLSDRSLGKGESLNIKRKGKAFRYVIVRREAYFTLCEGC